jgi:hypothetical protein
VQEVVIMLIESRTLFAAAGAVALVGAGLWASAMLLESRQAPPGMDAATVEVRQLEERSWAVEIKDLGALEAPSEATRTASR